MRGWRISDKKDGEIKRIKKIKSLDMINEIVLYQSDELSTKLEVRVEHETIWLTQAQIVTLFDSSKANISEHIKHIFKTDELNKNATVRKFRTVRQEGNRTVNRDLIHYNLDVVISIGYRVNSIRGTKFRIWANTILKDYLLRGYVLNDRINRIENDVRDISDKMSKIDLQIKADLLPNQGIFFDGQTYDAYDFINQLIKTAKHSIALIDNYIDDTVITQLTKKKKGVAVYLLSKTISKKLQLDVDKANAQYPTFKAVKFTNSHDRFLILDQKEVYHIGASLKDLGKKWFAFSKLEANSVCILEQIKELIT